jgi:hypothetical protein
MIKTCFNCGEQCYAEIIFNHTLDNPCAHFSNRCIECQCRVNGNYYYWYPAGTIPVDVRLVLNDA